MAGWVWERLNETGFQPHGFCLMWNPAVFWLHVVSDLLIAAAYLSIPVALGYLAVRRRDVRYSWLLYLFGAFIILCGLTHLMGVWTMWVPDYVAQGALKALTAAVSLGAAVVTVRLIPMLIRLPAAEDWKRNYRDLEREVAARIEAERRLRESNATLERRVAERTASLEAAVRESRAARAEAERQTRIKSDFLATVSHEIRTPMNGVLGMLSLLEHQPLDPKPRQFVGVALTSGRQLVRLLNDVLDFSKIEAGMMTLDPVEFDPAAMMAQVTAGFASVAQGKGVALIVEDRRQAPGAPFVGDQMRLGQVLSNLVSNALKFTSEGAVTVTLEDAGGGALRFTVRDTGIGIAPDIRDRLFERFVQADGSITRRFGGTGLGLSIVRRLAELMGGGVTVRSTVGEGSAFTVTVRPLPHTAEPAAVGDGAPALA